MNLSDCHQQVKLNNWILRHLVLLNKMFYLDYFKIQLLSFLTLTSDVDQKILLRERPRPCFYFVHNSWWTSNYEVWMNSSFIWNWFTVSPKRSLWLTYIFCSLTHTQLPGICWYKWNTSWWHWSLVTSGQWG